MKAMAITAYGQPLEPLDVAEPEAGPGQALVEVLACSVCFSDVKTARGKMPYSSSLTLPHVPGHEICARVVTCDPPDPFAPGALVIVYHVWPCRRCGRCRAGMDNQCTSPVAWTGFTHPGGFQQRLVVPVDRLIAVPDGIDPVHAAPMTCALGTAYRAVVSRGRVAPGSTVVVLGLGGVGIHALQVAAAAGSRALGIDVSPAAIAAARGLGLDALGPDDDADAAVMDATGGDGADVVVDVVGHPDTCLRAQRLVRAGGRVVAVGYGLDSDFAFPSTRFVLEEVELVGSRYALPFEMERAVQLVASGAVRTVVDSVRPLDQANDALDDLEGGRVVGRTVLDVGGVS